MFGKNLEQGYGCPSSGPAVVKFSLDGSCQERPRTHSGAVSLLRRSASAGARAIPGAKLVFQVMLMLRGEPMREAPMTDYDDLPFKIERWSDGYGRPEETIAMAADLLSAKAFEAAMKRRPGEPIMLRHKARVILKSLNDI